MINNLIDIKIIELNAQEPVSLDEVKEQAIITFSADDDLLTTLLTRARKMVENYCNISIVEKTIRIIADLYNEWELPYGPVTAITSVETRGSSEGSGPYVYSVAESGWGEDGEFFKRFVPQLQAGFSAQKPIAPRYRVVYTAGPYAPEDLIQAIVEQVVYLYEHRGEKNLELSSEAMRHAAPYVRQQWI